MICIMERLESRFLPIEIRNNNFSYSIEEEKIEPYNYESLEEIRNFMQDFLVKSLKKIMKRLNFSVFFYYFKYFLRYFRKN